MTTKRDGPDEVTAMLVRARRRITAIERWTAETTARDADGCPAFPRAPNAVAWCAIGALEAETPPVRPGDPHWTYAEGLHRLQEAAGCPPELVNDAQGHDAVLAMFDDAIRHK